MTAVLESTAPVVIVKVAVVAPAGTLTDPGTDALELLDARGTVAPPVGATDASVTVPLADWPPRTDVGDSVTLETETLLRLKVQRMPPPGGARARLARAGSVGDSGARLPVVTPVAVPPPVAVVPLVPSGPP